MDFGPAGLSSEALESHNLSHAAMVARKLTERYGSTGSSQPQSLAAPPAASSRGRHSGHPVNAAESELHSIRQELQEMQREVTRDMELGTLQAEMSSEISTLYEELQRAATKLDAERSLRRKIEAELEHVREDRLNQTSVVVQELEHKRNEIQQLRDERVELKQWLDRGAAECRRVADEVLTLRRELEQTESTCTMLAEEKSRLTNQIKELSDQLSEAQQTMEDMQHAKSVLEIRVRETQESIQLAEVAKANSLADVQRLESEVARLNQRVRGASDAEHSLGTLCTAVRQLIGEIQSLHRHIREGSLAERFEKPLVYLHPQPELSEAQTGDVVLASKLLVTNLLDAVRALEVDVKRFMHDKQRERIEEQRQHQDELAALHKEKELILQRYNVERQAMEKRQQDLERELLTVASGVQDSVNEEVSLRLAQLDNLIAANRDLQEQNEQLRRHNEQLTIKSKKMKVDWEKVDESRIRLQQLQMELKLMQEYHEKLANENKNLRLLAQQTGAIGSAPMGASAHGTHSTTPVLERHAFEEWKRRAM